jgi:hypothetical protein
MIIQNLSVEMMSLIIQLSTLLLVAVYGANVLDFRKAFIFGCYTMFLANIFGQLIIAGGGPGAFVGFIALPLWGGLAGCVVVFLAKLIRGWFNGFNRSHERI